jgi:hypothetical protein
MVGKHASPSPERVSLDSKGGFGATAPRVVRLLLGVTLWSMAVSGTQLVVGDDIGLPAREREERIERELKARSAPPPDPQQRERTHDDAIEPWELVGV